MPRSPAISFMLFQNSSSRLTLVLCPAITIERLQTKDLTTFSPRMITGTMRERLSDRIVTQYRIAFLTGWEQIQNCGRLVQPQGDTISEQNGLLHVRII